LDWDTLLCRINMVLLSGKFLKIDVRILVTKFHKLKVQEVYLYNGAK